MVADSRVKGDKGPLRLEVEQVGLLPNIRSFPQFQYPNLFASCLTFQLPWFFSWRPDPLAEAINAFLQDWKGLSGYAIPLWNLHVIGRVLATVEKPAEEVVLVAPIWPLQL